MPQFNVRTMLPDPPLPAGEADRIQLTRLRRRMMEGQWRPDAEQRMLRHFGPTRTSIVGSINLSSNVFRVTCRELATLYLSEPSVRHDSTADSELPEIIRAAGLWAQMPRYQSMVVGCREYLMRVEAPEGAGTLQYRPVAPDMVIATSSPATPDVPDSIMELRLRRDEKGYYWSWDVCDIRDPENPVYAVFVAKNNGDLGDDITEEVLGQTYSGAAYPYRLSDGTPILPYVLHHAERRGDCLWDYCEGIELLDGSLNVAVLLTMWDHVVFHASWPQRWVAGARPAALQTVDQDGRLVRQEVVSDPTSLLELEVTETSAGTTPQPQVGQFEPGADPESLLRAIDAYAHRLAQDAGVSASDIHQTSGDSRSGYAIALTNEGKRAAQRRFMPHFRDADERLIAVSAALYNRANGANFPEDGWRIVYTEIPLSPDELAARRDHALTLEERGHMSPVDAHMHLHPGLSREQARQDLERIRAERREFAMTNTQEDDNG